MNGWDKLQEQTASFNAGFENQRRNIGIGHQVKNKIILLSKKGIEALKVGSQDNLVRIKSEIIDSWNQLVDLRIPEDLKWQFLSEAGQELVEFFAVSILYPALFKNEDPDFDLFFLSLPDEIKPQILLAGLGDSVPELGKCLNDYLVSNRSLDNRVCLREHFCFFAQKIYSTLGQFETSYGLVVDNTRRPGFANTFRGLLWRISNVINHEKETLIFEQNLQVFSGRRGNGNQKRRNVVNEPEVATNASVLLSNNGSKVPFLAPDAYRAWMKERERIPWAKLASFFPGRPANGGSVTLKEYEAVKEQVLGNRVGVVRSSFLTKEGYAEWHRRGGSTFMSKVAIIRAVNKSDSIGIDELVTAFNEREKLIDRQDDGSEVECYLGGHVFQPSTFSFLADDGIPILTEGSPIRIGDFRGIEIEKEGRWVDYAICPACHNSDKDLRDVETYPRSEAEDFISRQNEKLRRREEREEQKARILKSVVREKFRGSGYRVK